MILVRLLAFLRRHWPQTHILVRGDSHFATPEVIEVLAHRHLIDVIFGLAGNPVLLRHAEPVLQEARQLHQQRTALAQAYHARPPDSSHLYAEFAYAAASWAQPWRVILKAEVMTADDNPRFVVTSLAAPTPQQTYEDIYCARGNCENYIKAVKCDLHSDCISATTFLANALRLLLSCAAYVLHHALRTSTLHSARAGPTLDGHAHPLQSGSAGQTVQRPYPPPPPEFLPRQSAAAPCDGLAGAGPPPRRQLVVRGPASPTLTAVGQPTVLMTRHRDVKAPLQGYRAPIVRCTLFLPPQDDEPGRVSLCPSLLPYV
jgi:Transposase DDE domain group 1